MWDWTRDAPAARDGLLAWRWADGRVVDHEPATDADLDAARALVLAASASTSRATRDAGRAIGARDRGGETTWAADRTVLVAGPWARGRAS